MRPFDWVIVAAALVLALGSGWIGSGGGAAGGEVAVTVQADGRVIDSWPLSRTGEVRRDTIEALRGPMVIETASRSVRVVASSCPDGWCERDGPVGPGGTIICAPNRVVIRLAGASAAAAVDGITE